MITPIVTYTNPIIVSQSVAKPLFKFVKRGRGVVEEYSGDTTLKKLGDHVLVVIAQLLQILRHGVSRRNVHVYRRTHVDTGTARELFEDCSVTVCRGCDLYCLVSMGAL